MNKVNGERMSRAIPKAAKDEALKLWLGGCSYREIRDRTKMSLGAVNQLIAEAKGRTPNIEELRELNIVLSKSGSSVYDAIRGGRLLDTMNRLGVGFDQIDGYAKLAEKISSERGVDAEGFVGSALKIMHQERETGKTYREIIEDFEGKLSEATKLEARMGNLKGETQELGTEKAKLEAELTETKKELTQKVQEMKRTISVKERLEKMGLEKLNALAEFTEDFEALSFDAKMVQNLSTWKKSLAEMGIAPNGLKRFVEEKGSLEAQISELRRTAGSLRSAVEGLGRRNKTLLEENHVLSLVDGILRNRKIVIPCKNCQWLLPIKLETRERYEYMIKSGLGLSVWCQRCGFQNWFAPWEALAQIGWILIPTREYKQSELK